MSQRQSEQALSHSQPTTLLTQLHNNTNNVNGNTNTNINMNMNINNNINNNINSMHQPLQNKQHTLTSSHRRQDDLTSPSYEKGVYVPSSTSSTSSPSPPSTAPINESTSVHRSSQSQQTSTQRHARHTHHPNLQATDSLPSLASSASMNDSASYPSYSQSLSQSQVTTPRSKIQTPPTLFKQNRQSKDKEEGEQKHHLHSHSHSHSQSQTNSHQHTPDHSNMDSEQPASQPSTQARSLPSIQTQTSHSHPSHSLQVHRQRSSGHSKFEPALSPSDIPHIVSPFSSSIRASPVTDTNMDTQEIIMVKKHEMTKLPSVSTSSPSQQHRSNVTSPKVQTIKHSSSQSTSYVSQTSTSTTILPSQNMQLLSFNSTSISDNMRELEDQELTETEQQVETLHSPDAVNQTQNRMHTPQSNEQEFKSQNAGLDSSDEKKVQSERHQNMSHQPKQISAVASPSSASSSSASLSSASSSSASASAQLTSSSSASSSSSSRPVQQDRFSAIRTLQRSLFGQVQLATDNTNKQLVAIKVSHSKLLNQDGGVSATSANGVSVLEDVRREEHVMKFLEHASNDIAILCLSICRTTNGLSQMFKYAFNNYILVHQQEAKRHVYAPFDPVVLKHEQSFPGTCALAQLLNDLKGGYRYLCKFHESVETAENHFLITEYISGGDLFSVLTHQPQHRVHEVVAKRWFKQICRGLLYMHAMSTAHLDLSLENVCMDESGNMKIIDFGLAATHPLHEPLRASQSQTFTPGKHIRILDVAGICAPNGNHMYASSHGYAACRCDECSVTDLQIIQTDADLTVAVKHAIELKKQAASSASPAGASASAASNQDSNTSISISTYSERLSEVLSFVCRPICRAVHKPGKVAYLSPELLANHSWDAYKNDVFALGVILYSFLVGGQPFGRADVTQDVWFRLTLSGQWLHPTVRAQQGAQVYAHVSPSALSLIDMLIKPQYARPTIDQILAHPWLADEQTYYLHSYPGVDAHQQHRRVINQLEAQAISLAQQELINGNQNTTNLPLSPAAILASTLSPLSEDQTWELAIRQVLDNVKNANSG